MYFNEWHSELLSGQDSKGIIISKVPKKKVTPLCSANHFRRSIVSVISMVWLCNNTSQWWHDANPFSTLLTFTLWKESKRIYHYQFYPLTSDIFYLTSMILSMSLEKSYRFMVSAPSLNFSRENCIFAFQTLGHRLAISETEGDLIQ